VRAKDHKLRGKIEQIIDSVEFGLHKLYPSRAGRPTTIKTNDFVFRQMRRQQKANRDVEIQTQFLTYKKTPHSLPIKVNFNSKIGLHAR